jgi:hypothetical protein
MSAQLPLVAGSMFSPKCFKWMQIVFPILTAGLVASASAQERQTTPASFPAAKEDLLGELPPHVKPLAHTFGDPFVNGGKSLVVVDGFEGKRYEELLADQWGPVKSTLRFGGESSVTYLAREGRKFYRVTQPLP